MDELPDFQNIPAVLKNIKPVYSLAAYLERLSRKAGKRLDKALAVIAAIAWSSSLWLFSHETFGSYKYISSGVVAAIGIIAFTWFYVRFSRRVRVKKVTTSRNFQGLYAYSNSVADGEKFRRLEREEEITQCLKLLQENNPVIAILGPSGSGKTSFMRAGIQYRLENPASNQLENKENPPRCLYWPAISPNATSSFIQFLQSSLQISLDGSLANLLSSQKAPPFPMVVFIDNFEHLLTTSPQDQQIFDFIARLCREPYSNHIQLLISINLADVGLWLNFLDSAQLRIPRVNISPLLVPKGIQVFAQLLENAEINVEPIVTARYVEEVSERNTVSPVDLAIGTMAFVSWRRSTRPLPAEQYKWLGGAPGILKYHVIQRLGPAYIIPMEDREPLVRGMVRSLIDSENDLMIEEGASLAAIAKAVKMEVAQVRDHLNSLVEGRILERPTPDTYRLSHQKLVHTFKDLAQTNTGRIIERYYLWRRELKKRKFLLRGNDLDWLLAYPDDFVVAVDAADRIKYIEKSIKARKWRYVYISCLAILLVSVLLISPYFVDRYRYHDMLSGAHISSDLYDRQNPLKSLTIEYEAQDPQSKSKYSTLRNLNWLHSSGISALTLKSQDLVSIDGIENIPNLKTLSLDLDKTLVTDLRPLTHLSQLTSLDLKHINRSSKTISLAVVEQLENLETLYLDYQGDRKTKLPDISSLGKLHTLSLDLRSNTSIVDLPDFSKIASLDTLRLLLDDTHLHSLKPVAELEHLNNLELSLTGKEAAYLDDLNGSTITSLTLVMTSYPPLRLPDLNGLHNLRNLNVVVYGSRGDLSSIRGLTQLRHLSIKVVGWDLPQLAIINDLTRLETLTLDLQGSRLTSIPDISALRQLESLSLNIGNTNIKELPDFSQFTNLNDLTILSRYTDITTLSGIDKLNHLQIATLDIVGTKLSRLPFPPGLERLTVYLRWPQLYELNNFSDLVALHVIELHFDSTSRLEEIPSFAKLEALEELDLYLEGSTVRDFPDLSNLKNLKRIRLNVSHSSMYDLSALANVTNLAELTMDLRYSSVEHFPDLKQLKHLDRVSVDVRYANPSLLVDLTKLSKVKELTLEHECKSLTYVPDTVEDLYLLP